MLSDFYGWKSLASLDLHGPHLSGGDVVFRAVIGPVPAGGPDEHPPVQRHPHRQHLAPEPICSAIPQGNPYRLQKKRTISTAGRVCSGSRKPQFTSTWILGRAVPLHTASSFRVLISTAGMPSAYRGNTSSRSVQSSGESGPPLSAVYWSAVSPQDGRNCSIYLRELERGARGLPLTLRSFPMRVPPP